MRTGAVIVAAGLSSRMGEFKPLLPLGNTTVIGQVIQTLRQAQVFPVIAVTGRESRRLTEYLEPMGVECICNHDFAKTDMFYSACLGMKQIRGRVEQFFFLPGDVPLFAHRTLEALKRQMKEEPCDMVQPVCEGRRGHPILLNADGIPRLLSYTGNAGFRGAIDEAGFQKKCLEVADVGMTMDADTKEDYRKLVQYLNKERQ